MTERRMQIPWEGDYPLGAHINHDERSKAFPAKVARTTTLKKKVHRHYGGALDQGNIGACVGFTGAGYLNCRPHRPLKRRMFENEDGYTLYSATTEIDPFQGTWLYPPPPGSGEDTGTDALSLCKVLRSRGLITRFEWAFGFDHVLGSLQLSPVMLGISWYSGFDRPDPKGVVKLDGYFRGRHEVLLVGLDPKLQLVKALNSWGPNWGVKGYFYFSFEALGTLLEAQGDAVVPQIG